MKKPIRSRHQIPFFYNKSEADFRQDPYERFDSMVLRQTALHLADERWDTYPFQSVNDWILEQCPKNKDQHIAEIGCGVGRLIATIAERLEAQCWGLDYSYQMLRQAQAYWVEGKKINLAGGDRGFKDLELSGRRLPQLNFGLAKASELPFDDETQDVLCSSFLLDRLEQGALALAEMHRVLRPDGLLLFVSPFNFQKKAHWDEWYPAEKLIAHLVQLGFALLKHEQDLEVLEPLDRHGNKIYWKCSGMAFRKTR